MNPPEVPQFLTEADIFRFLTQQAEKHGLKSLSANVGGVTGNYIAGWSAGMTCKIGPTVENVASQFPAPEQEAVELNTQADKLEKEASELRAKAKEIMGGEGLTR